ncbi:MAG: lamin tail domain-containing protein [Melioribacteraceae bacterium]|nr:lamin tail domain-containing protein [Melioribacteraceae bacterium]
MKKGIVLFLFLWQLSIFAQIGSSIIFSEVMFSPLETNGEFIELYNVSSDSSIDLRKFHIIYSTSAADSIIEFNDEEGIVLPPSSYAIIFENDYDFADGLYQNLVPNAALVLQIDNGKFGSSGMANSSNRTIHLLDEVGDTISTYTYSANNSAGISDEKIDIEGANSEENWGNSIVPHGTPGFRNSISPRDYDLEISVLEFYPEDIFADDEIEFIFLIKNRGRKEAANFEVKLFIDLNHDSLAQSSEIILLQNESVLQSGDSLNYSMLKSISESGTYNIFGVVNFIEDEKKENDSISINILIRPKPNEYADIVINEIMFKPNNDKPEWIELFNRNSLPINLKDWRFADRTSKPKIIDSLYFIGANEYLVLSEDETITDYYDITSDIIVLNLPSLNNVGDDLKLIDSLDQVIDSVNYKSDWGSDVGYSLERIDVDMDGNDSTNWNSSNSKYYGTPGRLNSATPKNIDLAMSDFIMLNNYGVIGESFNVRIIIKNIGLSSVTTFSLALFQDLNSNGIPEENELTADIPGSPMNSGDSTIIEYNITDFAEGENRYIAKIIIENDGNYENNETSISFVGVKINDVRNDIVINEIMHSPKSPEPEWIEVFNRSSKTINLMNYQIADVSDTATVVKGETLLNPNQYLIIADDSSFIETYPDVDNYIIASIPNLNNSGDKVILLDSLNRVIDSLQYKTSWGGVGGFSLERISADLDGNDSTNWNTSNSQQFATPGKINSITQRDVDLSIANIFALNDYAIMGGSFNVKIKINNIGLNAVTTFSLLFFNDINFNGIPEEDELTDDIAGSTINSGDSTLVEYNIIGFTEGENRYIAKVSVNNDGNMENNVKSISFVGVKFNEVRSDIVINEIMHSPKSPEPEWIEVFNRSSKTINLINYQIADMVDTTTISESEIILNQNQYLIIADDSSFIETYPDVDNYIIASIPNLNNSGDKVILLDSLDRVIDSLQYSSAWGGTNGKSLERIKVEHSSIDSVNWGSANTLIGGTPGKINSISQKNYDIELMEIYFNPAIPKFGESVRVSAKAKNVGKENIEFRLLLAEDVLLDSTNIVLREVSENIYLDFADSVVHQFNYFINSITEEREFIVNTSNFYDGDTTNNIIKKSIAPSFENASVVINEIMYSPINGEAEWIELYNNSTDSIDIKHFTISDIYTTPKTTIITDSSITFEPKGFLIIAKDSLLLDYHKEIPTPIIVRQFANLNNDIDGIVLKDRFGVVIDSMEYKVNWGGGSGYSIERRLSSNSSLDSLNWGSSTDIELSTPGRKNSITPFEYDLTIAKISTFPNPPMFDDEITFEILIKNIGLKDVENFNVQISTLIKDDNSMVENITGVQALAGDSLILKSVNSINLTDSVLVKAELIYDLDENINNNYYEMFIHPGAKRNSIIINEFIANPNSNEAEWIELLNNSNRSFDVSTWFISDLFPTPKEKQLADSPIIIGEDEYLIITNDTSKYLHNGNERVIEVKFGALGNIEDGILFYDFNMSLVDSLKYDKDWEIKKGRSLERLSAELKASDYSNWLLSLSVSGSSPGVSNSILETEPAAESSIIINEIMFDPALGNSEFIELYNSAEVPIDIGGWQLIDGSDNFYEISSTFLLIEPNQYYLFVSDSSIFKNYGELLNISEIKILESGSLSFSNIGERLVVIDHWGNMVDSVYYNPKWHNKNIATTKNKTLERISPLLGGNESSNWSTSVNKYGATPGSRNSIFAENRKSKTGLTFEPNPFSPDNDGFEDFSIVNYSLPFITAQVRIKIFDDKGRLVRTLVNNEASSSEGAIVFDGLNDAGNPLRIGMYIVFLEAVDINSGKSIAYKDVIVVARKL